MATDVFGDSSLFEEFEKERLPRSSYIKKDLQTEGKEDENKHIVFDFESDSESSVNTDSSDEELQQQHSTETERANENLQRESTSSRNGSLKSNSTNCVSSQKNDDKDHNCQKVSILEKDNVQKLHKELDKLKRFSKLLDSTRYVDFEDGPAVQIIYQNNDIARKYRNNIEQYISSLIENEKRYEQREKLADLRLKASTLSRVDLNPNHCKEDSMDCWTSHAIIGSSQMYEDFILDTLGWPLVQHTPALTEGWEVPSYEQVFTKAMPCEDEDENMCPAPKRKARAKAACFNCGESHMLSECPEPKDQGRIRQNRREFMDQSGGSPGSLSKGIGSQNIEDDPRFVSFKAGTVSDDLREALGLKAHQIPSYIYKMRLQGYPPGWKQEAQEQKSGIALFDKHGKVVTESGEQLEDGEMNPDYKPAMIDPSKIIEYEGFTVPLSEGKVDEHKYFNLPPLQPHQMKTMVEQMHSQIKQQQDSAKGAKRSRPLSTDDDMDLDSDYAATPAKRLSQSFMSPPPLPIDTPPGNPPLPDGTPPPTPPVTQGRALSFDGTLRPSLDRSNSSMTNSPGTTASESLEDLESQYKVLMQQLAAEEGKESDMVVIDEYDSSKEREDGELSQDDSQCSDNTQIIEIDSESPSTSTTSGVVDNSKTENVIIKPSVSLSKDYGTPIHEKAATASLPDPSKFGTGIEDHIPFENLPDSTGTFQKLKGLLGKIREKVSGSRKKKANS